MTAWIFFKTQNEILSCTFYSKITQFSIEISETITWFGELTFYGKQEAGNQQNNFKNFCQFFFSVVLYLNISCLYCSALRLKFSTATFNMTRLAHNNVYRALMGIIRGYGHSISSEYYTNNIDGFEAVLRKMTTSLRGWLHTGLNTVAASYVSSPYFMLSSPLCVKWNREALILWESII